MTNKEKNILALIIVCFILYFYGIFVSIYDRKNTETELISNLETQINQLKYELEYNNYVLEQNLKEN